jgi:hypothetical protein
MAATKNTLAALWGRKLQDDRKTKSNDHGSVISTRSKAAEDKQMAEKEATSRPPQPAVEKTVVESKPTVADATPDEATGAVPAPQVPREHHPYLHE